MAEAVAEKTETMDDTRKKLREIYSFTFEKEEMNGDIGAKI